jgi:thiol-disulfide isomerase/thioredoxin
VKRIRAVAFTLVAAFALVVLFVLLRRFEVWIGAGSFLSGILAGVVLTALAIARMIYSTQRKVKEMRQERLRVALPAPRLPTDETAIYHWKVRKLDGTLAAMDDLIRHVAFLNFWSTMCMPCVKELASIERLHSMLREEGVVFMCIASDQDLEKLRAWVAENNVSVPVFSLAGDSMPPMFDSEFIPATYVVAADSRIALKHEGAAAWDHPSVVRFLRGLVAEGDILALPTNRPDPVPSS